MKQAQISVAPPRTLTTLAADHQAFVQDGSRTPRAKLFRNAIRPAILPIPIDHASLPALHLDLGIFVWLFEALKKECSNLDLQLARVAHADADDSSEFAKLTETHALVAANQAELSEHEQQLASWRVHLEWIALHHHIVEAQGACPQTLAGGLQRQCQLTSAKVSVLQQELTGLQATLSTAAIADGPCTSCLEPVLQRHNITRQAYHGGAFVGNHVHKALTESVIADLTAAVVATVAARGPSLAADALCISKRYTTLLESFAQFRARYSTCSSVTEQECQELQDLITEFLISYIADVRWLKGVWAISLPSCIY